MTDRNIRAVLMDVHGVPFEKKTPNDDPRLVAKSGREFWAFCAKRAIKEIAGISVAIDPMQLWEARCEIELCTRRVAEGRVIPQRDYWDKVNRLVLEAVASEVMKTLKPADKTRAGRKMRKLHHQDHPEHKMYPDMRELMHWICDVGLGLYLQTAQTEQQIWDMFRRCNAPVRRVSGVFTTHMIGFTKLRPEFWQAILNNLKIEPWETVVIGNNAVQDTCCTEVGIPALILDRDGQWERWCRNRGNRLRGTPLLQSPKEIPPQAAFIAFEKSPKQIRCWLQAITLVTSSP